MALALLGGLGACAPDPGELPAACEPRVLEPGEVRVKRIACADELVAGGEGAVGDWLLENAELRLVVRGPYAALTQLGEEGGTLIDAATVGGSDLLMELAPAADRSTVEAWAQDDAVELRLPGVVYRLEADAQRLDIRDPDGGALDAVWVPRPGALHVDGVARSGAAFFALELPDALPVEADARGQIPVEGLTGVALSPAARWPDGEQRTIEVDADRVQLLQDGRAVDSVPVVGTGVELTVPPGATLAPERAGCAYDALSLRGCAGVAVWVQDEAGRPLAASVRFDGRELPLGVGGGYAGLGLEPGELWVWAGPGHAAWRGWYAGRDTELRLTLDRVMPAEEAWPEAGGDFPEGGARLAAFGVEVAPDADHGTYAADAFHALRAQGVGYVNALADEEFPTLGVWPGDELLLTSGTRVGGDVWAWGWSGSARRAGHSAVDDEGFGALDRATLVRSGAGVDRMVVVRPEWVEAARAEAAAWAWPVKPDALWLDGPEDLATLRWLAEQRVDAQPLAERVWLPHEGVANLAVTARALAERSASAGNGPRVDVALRRVPGQVFLDVQVYGAGWMGPLQATLHTDRGEEPLALDAEGRANRVLFDEEWVMVSVSARASRPWGGDPAWAVSAVRWVRS